MADHSKQLAILVHGLGCAPRHLQTWAAVLSPDFPNIVMPDLPATRGSFADCLAKLEAALAAAHTERYDELLCAGHSMGGLLLCAYLAKHRPANARRLVYVGTPHGGSPLADLALLFPFVGRIFPTLYALQSKRPLEFPELQGVSIASIEGVANTLFWGKLFLPTPADGRVTLASAQTPDAEMHLQLALNHDELMRSPEVARAIANFFERGSLQNI